MSHNALAEPYAYLPIEAYSGDVGNNIKLKCQKNSSLVWTNSNESQVCSMNWSNWVSVLSFEEAYFCYMYDYSWETERKGPTCFWQCKRASGSIQNGSMETIPERFCSVNRLLAFLTLYFVLCVCVCVCRFMLKLPFQLTSCRETWWCMLFLTRRNWACHVSWPWTPSRGVVWVLLSCIRSRKICTVVLYSPLLGGFACL